MHFHVGGMVVRFSSGLPSIARAIFELANCELTAHNQAIRVVSGFSRMAFDTELVSRH